MRMGSPGICGKLGQERTDVHPDPVHSSTQTRTVCESGSALKETAASTLDKEERILASADRLTAGGDVVDGPRTPSANRQSGVESR